MGRKAKAGRPKPFSVGDIHVRVIRGPKGGAWYWRAERHLDRRTIWLGWGSPSEAATAVARIVADGIPEEPGEGEGEGSGVETVDHLMRAWYAHLEDDEPDIKPTSMKAYKLTVRHLREVMGEVKLTDLSQKALIDARNKMRKRFAPQTVLASLDRLRAAHAWARGAGVITATALPEVEVEIPKVARRSPSQDEIRQVIRVLAEGPVRWHYLALRIMHATGARIGEVGLARREDLDVPRRRLHLDGKTGPRWVVLPADLVDELASHRHTHERPELLGVSLNSVRVMLARDIRAICRKLSIPYFSPHRVRSAFIDHAQTSGVDVATTCAFTGHTPAVMFEYYRRATEQDMARALDRAALGVLEEPDEQSPGSEGGESGGRRNAQRKTHNRPRAGRGPPGRDVHRDDLDRKGAEDSEAVGSSGSDGAEVCVHQNSPSVDGETHSETHRFSRPRDWLRADYEEAVRALERARAELLSYRSWPLPARAVELLLSDAIVDAHQRVADTVAALDRVSRGAGLDIH